MTDAERLAKDLGELAQNPRGFVQYAFAWGEGELADYEGPDDWQAKVLDEIGEGLKTADQVIREAVASGHGVGKSALISWIILWALATCTDARGVVTANTGAQLKGKTWAELAKWHRLLIQPIRDLFEVTATAICSTDPEHRLTWRIDAVPWSETNTEAFAGLHNKGRRLLALMDEASAIPDVIHEVTEGALTDEGTEIIWCQFGNPTRNTGRFRECFGKNRHRWKTHKVDSRSARMTNKTLIQQWVDDYGEDSDFVRVRVKGDFPRAAATQFIGSDIVEMARKREAVSHLREPLVLGVDVGRFGDDETVILPRRGRDARTHKARKYRGLDTMQVAAQVVQAIEDLKPNAVFVDEGGVGGGVVDRLRQLGFVVQGINFGSKADRSSLDAAGAGGERYANKRAEMWGVMRQWLKGGAIEDSGDLESDLIGVEYGYNADNAIQLEKKEDMKKRGLASPDWGDALALTFAYPVAEFQSVRPVGTATGNRAKATSEYNPLEAA